MEQIRVLHHLVLTVMCFVCLGFSVGMCSDSDALIKSYVSSSLPSGDLLDDSAKLQVHNITYSEWDSLVLWSHVPVMVMFTVEWCDPCRLMIPILNKLESEFTGKFTFYIVNDRETYIRARYSVRVFPTIIVFNLGELMDNLVGPIPESRLRELIGQYV